MIVINIRLGEIKDFDRLKWAWNDNKKTLKKYIQSIKNGIHEFIVIEDNDLLIGELHIIWKSDDLDEADGLKRAYICAFRIHKDYQNKKFGKMLIDYAINRIKDKKFTEVTLGVCEYITIKTEIYKIINFIFKKKNNNKYELLKQMYKKWGFREFKYTNKDIHNFDNTSKKKVTILKKDI